MPEGRGIRAYYFDDFKSINDTYGHASGDDALKAISSGLKSACGSMNDQRPFIARYGGDEFFVALRTMDDARVHLAANDIRQAIDRSCQQMNLPFPISISIGWAFQRPGESAIDCMARADANLYQQKWKFHRKR